MTLITKPDFTYVWASGGAVVAPNDSKKQLGWVAEAPPFQYDNWLQNRQDQMLAHINQRGMPAWDGLTNYEAGGLSYVQGSDGKVYKSVAASGPSATVQNPTTDGTDTYWTIAFADVGAFLTQTAGDARYTQRSNNLADLTNVATARNNLSVYSKLESDNFGINSTRIDVASASTVNLTTSAPNTRNINITGTTTITAFTVTAGQLYFVRFNSSLILTNNANIVTNRGANITTAAGDTCIIRATAGNTVEILCGDFLSEAAVGTRGQTWQNVAGSRVAGTTYTNTTGRPIMVAIDTSSASVIVDGLELVASGAYGAQFIVPVGSTYSVAAGGVIEKWLELR